MGLMRDQDDGVTSLDVRLVQQDAVAIDDDRVLVIRTQPVIAIEELRLTLCRRLVACPGDPAVRGLMADEARRAGPLERPLPAYSLSSRYRP
jgi:hypothetical protein